MKAYPESWLAHLTHISAPFLDLLSHYTMGFEFESWLCCILTYLLCGNGQVIGTFPRLLGDSNSTKLNDNLPSSTCTYVFEHNEY